MRKGRLTLTALLLAGAVPGPAAEKAPSRRAQAAASPAAVDPARRAQLLREYAERVDKYVELHKKLASEAPKLKDKATAEEIRQHQLALAAAIRKARAGARPGDVIVPEVQPIFRQILRAELTGPGSKPARETVKEGNPKVETPQKKVVVAVNAVYPPDAPVSSVPPSILFRLPRLPEDVLEYRFVGRDLIILDNVADLVVDFVRVAVP